MTLNELASSAESETVRATAANSLLDKYLRNKPVKVDDAADDPQEELKRLDERLAQLESETKAS